jgi:hypothetical protein
MTTAQIKRRLDALQPRGYCRCRGNELRVLWPPEYVPVYGGPVPDPGPEVCPRCGRERHTVRVEYVEDWRGADGK